jgi:hypothetical protein
MRIPASGVCEIERHVNRGRDTNPFQALTIDEHVVDSQWQKVSIVHQAGGGGELNAPKLPIHKDRTPGAA